MKKLKYIMMSMFAFLFSMFLFGGNEVKAIDYLPVGNNGLYSIVNLVGSTPFVTGGPNGSVTIKDISSDSDVKQYTLTKIGKDGIQVFTNCTYQSNQFSDVEYRGKFECSNYYNVLDASGELVLNGASRIFEMYFFNVGEDTESVTMIHGVNYYFYSLTVSYSAYLGYGDIKYNEGKNSVDITSDNQSAIDSYIEENNYHSNEDYISYGETKYNEGKNSVDITSDNQSAIDSYIEENNYHSNEDYISYGETKYNEGKNSVDITSDNLDAVEKFLRDNKYYNSTEYQDYGKAQYANGYKQGILSVDITSDNETAISSYIEENKYHSNEDYLSYGKSRYETGYEDNSLRNNIDLFFEDLSKFFKKYILLGFIFD